MDSGVVVSQVLPGQTWNLILSLVNVWSSPLYGMSVCPLLTSVTAVIRICWFLIVLLVKMLIYLPQINRESGMVVPINLV